MKALVGTFNQEKALVGAFSVIVNIDCETDGSYAVLAQAQARITDRCSAPPPDTVFPDTSLTAAVASQGMVTGQVTKTTHCTYQLAGTCHLVSIQGLSIFILVDI